jgi:hypothetical protein
MWFVSGSRSGCRCTVKWLVPGSRCRMEWLVPESWLGRHYTEKPLAGSTARSSTSMGASRHQAAPRRHAPHRGCSCRVVVLHARLSGRATPVPWPCSCAPAWGRKAAPPQRLLEPYTLSASGPASHAPVDMPRLLCLWGRAAPGHLTLVASGGHRLGERSRSPSSSVPRAGSSRAARDRRRAPSLSLCKWRLRKGEESETEDKIRVSSLFIWVAFCLNKS